MPYNRETLEKKIADIKLQIKNTINTSVRFKLEQRLKYLEKELSKIS